MFINNSYICRSMSSRCKKQEWLDEVEVNDNNKREAKFAFRTCDLKSWKSSSPHNPEEETDLDPKYI